MSKFLLPQGKEESKGFLKSLHCAIGGLSKGFGHLIRHRERFYKMICWEDEADYNPEEVQDVFETFNIPLGVAKDLAVLHPRVKNGRPTANLSCASWSMERVLGLYLYLWQFRDFNDARFGGIGPSLRSLVLNTLVGTIIFV